MQFTNASGDLMDFLDNGKQMMLELICPKAGDAIISHTDRIIMFLVST